MTAPTSAQRRRLEEQGYVILKDYIPQPLVSELKSEIERLFDEEGERAGAEFKSEPGCRRLANLVDKGEVFRRALLLPGLLDYVRCVLGDELKLSSLNARSAEPAASQDQPLHTDMGALPDRFGPWVANTVWMLSDLTEANGAIRVIPTSHRWERLPTGDVCFRKHDREVLLTGTAGTLVVMNAHLWHGGTANRSSEPRLAMHAFFCRSDKPQQQYQKGLLSEQTQNSLSPELRSLLALDDAENDRLSAAPGQTSGFLS